MDTIPESAAAAAAAATVNPEEVDKLLAAELNAMSFRERETLYEEIHGVEREIEETEQLLEESLWAMERVLQTSRHIARHRHLYEQAMQMNPSYMDRAFKLMFLRAENFDPDLAAQRLVLFLEGKTRFFGEETLARPITLDDFNTDDMAFMKGGICQTIPARDRSGRVIFADFNMSPSLPQPKNVDSLIKTVIYTVCAAAENEETQKRGMVGIFYFTSATKTVQQLHQRKANMFDWLPVKIVGGHFCFNDPRCRLVKALLMLAIGKDLRLRLRLHEGSHTECQYKMLTFGVPTKSFPVTYDGELKNTNHLKWLARRKVKESALKKYGYFEGIDMPSLRDVLQGRGKSLQEHSGNVVMRNLVSKYFVEYKQALKHQKGIYVLNVLGDVRQLGGRFLRREDNGWWVEMSDEAAREKVSMTFRTTTMSDIEMTQHQNARPAQHLHSTSSISQMAVQHDSKRARHHDSGSEDDGVETGIACFSFR